jgi:membrane protein DedA with SNARE-associated domain
MEALAEIIFSHLGYAHYIMFGLLLLAGLNVPISEDFILILSGMLASTVMPEQTTTLFIWVFLGAYLSDWEAYWIGRWLGKRIFRVPWLAKRLPRRRIAQVGLFYKQYGVWTLLIGRFIPIGVRNCLFMAAGIGRMHFGKFLLSDGLACLVSNTTLFFLAYSFGRNYLMLYDLVLAFNTVIFSVFALILSAGLLWWGRRRFWLEPQGKRG